MYRYTLRRSSRPVRQRHRFNNRILPYSLVSIPNCRSALDLLIVINPPYPNIERASISLEHSYQRSDPSNLDCVLVLIPFAHVLGHRLYTLLPPVLGLSMSI